MNCDCCERGTPIEWAVSIEAIMLRAILISAVLASVGECSDFADFKHVIHKILRHDAKLDGLADESVCVIANAIRVGATKESIVSGLGSD